MVGVVLILPGPEGTPNFYFFFFKEMDRIVQDETFISELIAEAVQAPLAFGSCWRALKETE